MAAVMIGIDPHKASHTAVVISAAEEELGELRVRACAGQRFPEPGGGSGTSSRRSLPGPPKACWWIAFMTGHFPSHWPGWANATRGGVVAEAVAAGPGDNGGARAAGWSSGRGGRPGRRRPPQERRRGCGTSPPAPGRSSSRARDRMSAAASAHPGWKPATGHRPRPGPPRPPASVQWPEHVAGTRIVWSPPASWSSRRTSESLLGSGGTIAVRHQAVTLTSAGSARVSRIERSPGV